MLDNPMRSRKKPVIKLPLSLGVLAEPLLEFLVFAEVGLTDQDRLRSVTCVEVDECLLRRELGADGTEISTPTRSDMPFAALLPQLLSQLWSCPKGI